MEIWLLLTAAVVVSSTKISLDQERKSKIVSEGSSVSLFCGVWNKSAERSRVSWYFNPREPSKSGSTNLSTKIYSSSHELPILTLHNLSQNNSGWYYCNAKEEIPVMRDNNSNWTELNVVTKKPLEARDWWLWIALGSSGLVLLILLMCVFFVRRIQLKKRDLACPIYANTGGSRQPSPRPRPTDSPPKTDSPYENLQHPDWRYEHSRRLPPRT